MVLKDGNGLSVIPGQSQPTPGGRQGTVVVLVLLNGGTCSTERYSVCFQSSEDHMKQHYLDLKDMPFYAGLCKYMSSGPVFAMVTHQHK